MFCHYENAALNYLTGSKFLTPNLELFFLQWIVVYYYCYLVGLRRNFG